jgi:hypothetical protein
LGITRTNNIHLFKVEMGNGICDEYVDVRKRNLKGFMEQLHMSWDILGSNTFWLQMSLSIHGWMKDLQLCFRFAENEFD